MKPATGSIPTRQGLPQWKCSSAITVMVWGFICLGQGRLFLVAEGNEVRLEVSRQGMQGATRGSDETVELARCRNSPTGRMPQAPRC